jgi:hypothetical protein
MAKIEIRCPSCSQVGYINVSEDAMKNVSRGLLAVNIAEHTICSHSFITYIDKNLNVRDYFVADFQIEIPDIAPPEDLEELDKRIPGRDIIDIDLIKLNLPAILITYVIKSIFSKEKVKIISDQEFLHNHIINFFKYINQDSFDIDVSIITGEDYKANKKKYKDSMIFKSTQIIQNIKKRIDPKKLKVEKEIVNRFLTEPELGYSYIVLKNEVYKAYKLTQSIVEYADNYKEIENIDPNKLAEDAAVSSFLDHLVNKEKLILKILTDYLEKIHHVRIQKQYLTFLLGIVKDYFGVDIQEKIVITAV